MWLIYYIYLISIDLTGRINVVNLVVTINENDTSVTIKYINVMLKIMRSNLMNVSTSTIYYNG